MKCNRFRGEQVPARSPPSFKVLRFLHTFFVLRLLRRRRCFYSSVLALRSCTFLPVQPHCWSLVSAPEVGIFAHKYPWTRSSKDGSFHSLKFSKSIPSTGRPYLSFHSAQLLCFLDRARWATQFAQTVPREASPGCPMTRIPPWPTQMMLPSTYR